MIPCELILTGFADEAAISKTADQQFSAFAALGLQYLSIRFIDVGNGVKNIMDLDPNELERLMEKLDQYGLKVSSIGSPIGKTKLLNVEDGTNNSYHDFDEYLESHVRHACEIARKLNTKLIRGFSFYHPKGEQPLQYVSQSAPRIAAICELCDSYDLTFGLEVEANLIGQNAETLTAICQAVDSDALVLIFDGANLVTQGYSKAEIVQQYRDMSHSIGWIHIKDYKATALTTKSNYIDEDSLPHFVPAGSGDSGYPEILELIKDSYAEISGRMKARGVSGVFADLEPHLKGGGQFGGFSGPDGFGVAVRSFCELCDIAGIAYQLRDYDSICP